MQKYLLISTHQRGFECDPVIDQLRLLGVPIFRFNCENGYEVSGVSVSFSGALSTEILFSCDGRTISSREIRAGWFQQSPPFAGQPQNKDQSLQNNNILASYRGALEMLDIPWFNKPSAVERASNKILQLHAARSVGLSTPETLISNIPADIRVFCQNGKVVAKNLASPWIIDGKEAVGAYTAIVKKEWMNDDKSLSFCPVIYQKYFLRRRDFRVVLVGEKVFTASCEPKEHQLVDIRRGSSSEHGYVACNFPEELISRLRNLMAHFGTQYCSADFMENEDGDIFFLDLNSCGAWWWLDPVFDGAISSALVDQLAHLVKK